MDNSANLLSKHPHYNVSSAKAQQGAMLLEALIAIVIFSMGILALVGLQASMLSNTSNAKYRADASYVAQQRIGQMWADSDNAINYLENQTDVPGLPNGKRTVTQPNLNQFLVTVTWQAPGDPEQHNVVMNASIVKVMPN
nr:prepilin-type cleavage/methylation domain-containing protein [uncultured Methylotenera sp.]